MDDVHIDEFLESLPRMNEVLGVQLPAVCKKIQGWNFVFPDLAGIGRKVTE